MRLRIVMPVLQLAVTALVSCHTARPVPESIPAGSRAGVMRGRTLTLHFVEWPGRGTPIVLLHGLGGNALWWSVLARHLPGRHLIAIDMPGHGESPTPTSWALEPMAREIAELVDQRWPAGHVWIGHSWGGKLAVAAAAADGRSARGLVLVDAVPIPVVRADPAPLASRLFAGELEPWPSMDQAIAAVRKLPQYTPWSQDLEQAFRRAVDVEASGRVVPRLSHAKAVAVMQPLFATDLTASAAQLQVPVLVIGAPDFRAAQDAHRQTFPNAKHVSLPGNHWLHVSNVEGVGRELRAWLEANQL